MPSCFVNLLNFMEPVYTSLQLMLVKLLVLGVRQRLRWDKPFDVLLTSMCSCQLPASDCTLQTAGILPPHP